jgi:hypothetical protein
MPQPSHRKEKEKLQSKDIPNEMECLFAYGLYGQMNTQEKYKPVES